MKLSIRTYPFQKVRVVCLVASKRLVFQHVVGLQFPVAHEVEIGIVI
jgi:hypothetical protein